MQNHHVSHALQYSILVVIFLVTIPLLFFSTDKLVRTTLIAFLSLIYLIFGVLHHKEEKKLTTGIFFEYAAISLLIFVILFSLFA